MAWDFTVDSDIQLDMAKVLKNKSEELDTQFANLYTQIAPSNLGTPWVGSDYDAFNVGCEGYKQALQDMTDSIRMYADHFESVAEGTDALSSMCISIVQNMTTRGDALPGGQLPVAPNINYPTGGNPTGGTQYVDNNGKILSTATTFTAPTTLYAHWTPNTYDLTIDPNGGTMYNGDNTTTSSFTTKFVYDRKKLLCDFLYRKKAAEAAFYFLNLMI